MAGWLFDPNSVEWLALFSFMLITMVSPVVHTVTAIGGGWYFMWKRLSKEEPKKRHVPRFFHPQLSEVIRYTVMAMAGFSAWFVWRMAYRLENAPIYAKSLFGPDPDSGYDEDFDLPSQSTFFCSMLFYLLFLFFSIVAPLANFGLAYQLRMRMTARTLGFLVFGLAVATTVSFWIMVPLSGIFMAVVSLFYLYNLYVVFIFTRNITKSLVTFESYLFTLLTPTTTEQQSQYPQNMDYEQYI